MRYPKYPQKHLPRVFDTSFDYKTDTPRTKPDPDGGSQLLRWDHELLWSKELPSGDVFAPKVTTRQREYLIFTDANTDRYCYGSDAITSSYTKWEKKKRPRSRALADAITGLDDEQRARYLNPPYTIGSAMIWPVRARDYWTMNRARGARLLIADRMDLTLECIRRHYTGEPDSPLADVTTAYKDFFELFGQREQGFKEFVDFFHFQDLIEPGSDYQEIEYFLKPNKFKRSGTPATTHEYIEYRENVLAFIEKRSERMAKWVTKHHSEIGVRHSD
ncbi:hypothetical protein QF038_001875 [Pseudarthrobacter sp. W1I19]|uniref:DUF6994 family protein n=1 Tax=Pseudarthrobacter sp. W1I19 TaxID=3042288 RepID=UPI00277FA39B|nr:hypothetical protein [Pseudarthrobacter sp. W1I19]MDQ0923367.1 hypothetical protein [Pseudarthrobacter sp. W1I19]